MNENIRMIPIDKLKPLFPREGEDDEVEELASSLRLCGLLHPILVRRSSSEADVFELIAGWRRLQAAKVAGLQSVPCRVIQCSDDEALRICMIENIQRRDLPDIEIARRLAEYKKLTGFSESRIASLLSKSQSWISRHLQMLRLDMPRDIAEKLTEKHFRAILSQPETVRPRLVNFVNEQIEAGKLPSARMIERKAKELLLSPKENEEEVREESIEEILEAAERVVEEPDSAQFVEITCPQDVDEFFDNILKVVGPKGDEKSVFACPCGCNWTISINWRTRDVEWITP